MSRKARYGFHLIERKMGHLYMAIVGTDNIFKYLEKLYLLMTDDVKHVMYIIITRTPVVEVSGTTLYDTEVHPVLFTTEEDVNEEKKFLEHGNYSSTKVEIVKLYVEPKEIKDYINKIEENDTEMI